MNDIKLSLHNAKRHPARYGITFPAVLSRVFEERGYTHAKIRVTDEGILLMPYVADNNNGPVDIPNWS